MTAQEKWKMLFRWWVSGMYRSLTKKTIAKRREHMKTMRREAALERKLAAAQRTIEAQAERIRRLELETVDAWNMVEEQS